MNSAVLVGCGVWGLESLLRSLRLNEESLESMTMWRLSWSQCQHRNAHSSGCDRNLHSDKTDTDWGACLPQIALVTPCLGETTMALGQALRLWEVFTGSSIHWNAGSSGLWPRQWLQDWQRHKNAGYCVPERWGPQGRLGLWQRPLGLMFPMFMGSRDHSSWDDCRWKNTPTFQTQLNLTPRSTPKAFHSTGFHLWRDKPVDTDAGERGTELRWSPTLMADTQALEPSPATSHRAPQHKSEMECEAGTRMREVCMGGWCPRSNSAVLPNTCSWGRRLSGQ